VGTTLDDAIVTYEELASQAISDLDVDVGDSFTMKFTLDLPSVAVENASDLTFEIFGITPDQSTFSLNECLLFCT